MGNSKFEKSENLTKNELVMLVRKNRSISLRLIMLGIAVIVLSGVIEYWFLASERVWIVIFLGLSWFMVGMGLLLGSLIPIKWLEKNRRSLSMANTTTIGITKKGQ